MTAFCSYTGGESCTPLIYRFVYDVLSNPVPHTQQALTQLVDVIYAFIVDLQLHYSPDLIIHRCLGATGQEKWSLASLGVKVRLCHVPCAQVRCPVGIWNCHPIFPDAWQQLLLQQYFTIIVAVTFTPSCTISYSNRTAHLRTGRVTQWHFYAERRQTSFLSTSGPQTAQIWTPLIIRSGL